jgi:hypothetical protein
LDKPKEQLKAPLDALIAMIPDEPAFAQIEPMPRVFCQNIPRCLDFPKKCATCKKNEMSNYYEHVGAPD